MAGESNSEPSWQMPSLERIDRAGIETGHEDPTSRQLSSDSPGLLVGAIG